MALNTKRILRRLQEAERRNRDARRRNSQVARWAARQEFPFRELGAIYRLWLGWRAFNFAKAARRHRLAFRDALDADAALHRTGRRGQFAAAIAASKRTKTKERPPWANDA